MYENFVAGAELALWLVGFFGVLFIAGLIGLVLYAFVIALLE